MWFTGYFVAVLAVLVIIGMCGEFPSESYVYVDPNYLMFIRKFECENFGLIRKKKLQNNLSPIESFFFHY